MHDNLIDLDAIHIAIKHGNLTEIAEHTKLDYRLLQKWRLDINNWLPTAENRFRALQNYINDKQSND